MDNQTNTASNDVIKAEIEANTNAPIVVGKNNKQQVINNYTNCIFNGSDFLPDLLPKNSGVQIAEILTEAVEKRLSTEANAAGVSFADEILRDTLTPWIAQYPIPLWKLASSIANPIGQRLYKSGHWDIHAKPDKLGHNLPYGELSIVSLRILYKVSSYWNIALHETNKLFKERLNSSSQFRLCDSRKYELLPSREFLSKNPEDYRETGKEYIFIETEPGWRETRVNIPGFIGWDLNTSYVFIAGIALDLIRIGSSSNAGSQFVKRLTELGEAKKE